MKRLITVLALVPVLALAACGGSEDEPGAAPASAATSTAHRDGDGHPGRDGDRDPRAGAGRCNESGHQGVRFRP